MSNRLLTIQEVHEELEDAWLTDLHFLAGNEWVRGQGTPARTPFRYLLARSRFLHLKYNWLDSHLQVKTVSQYERISS